MSSEHIVNVSIDGMTCSSCVYKVESELSDLDGVIEAKVDLAKKHGTVKYDASKPVGPKEIVELINKLGFKAAQI